MILAGGVQKWVTKMKAIDGQSRVYTANLFLQGIPITVKNPKSEQMVAALREYCIGIKAVNRLRYTLPYFLYTLGAFMYPEQTLTVSHPKPSVFMLQENIPGTRLDHLLQQGMDFSTWLGIFCQLLLALEVAQREISFTHFDLHAGNVIVRTVAIPELTILLDDKAYVLESLDLLPVIIDFGASSASVDCRQIGSYDYSRFGMLHLMIPGCDAYKLMNSCCQHASNLQTRRDIKGIARFYGREGSLPR